jgi:hypothetical protein
MYMNGLPYREAGMLFFELVVIFTVKDFLLILRTDLLPCIFHIFANSGRCGELEVR